MNGRQVNESLAAKLGAISLVGLSFLSEASAAEPQNKNSVALNSPTSSALDTSLDVTTPRKTALQRGDQIPSVIAKSAEGKDVDISTLVQGKLTLIKFWGPWCGSCLRELNSPAVQAVPAQLDKIQIIDPESGQAIARDFQVVAVGANYKVSDVSGWRSRIQSNPLLKRATNLQVDDAKMIQTMEAELLYVGYPSWILVDGTGRVLFSSELKEPVESNGRTVMVTRGVEEIPALLKRDGYLRPEGTPLADRGTQ